MKNLFQVENGDVAAYFEKLKQKNAQPAPLSPQQASPIGKDKFTPIDAPVFIIIICFIQFLCRKQKAQVQRGSMLQEVQTLFIQRTPRPELVMVVIVS